MMVTRCDGRECVEIRPPGAKDWLTVNDGSQDDQDGEYDLCPVHKELFIKLIRYREPAKTTAPTATPACAGCAKVARHPGEGYECILHPAEVA